MPKAAPETDQEAVPQAPHSFVGIDHTPMSSFLRESVSTVSLLKKRYLNTGIDVYGLGVRLNASRLGAYCQRLSDQLYQNATNRGEASHLAHGYWSFEQRKWMPTPKSDYTESLVPAVSNIRWILIESFCFEFDVDSFGSLYVKSMSGFVSHLIIYIIFINN